MASAHTTKCIFCYGKKPDPIVKYEWLRLKEYYDATISYHTNNAYLKNEFENKGFWRWEAKHVQWKIRWQGAKRRPKIKPFWEQLEAKGIRSNLYCSFVVTLDKEVVEKYIDNEDY